MTTKTTKPNVLIVGSGQMGQRIHEQWVERYNLLNESEFNYSIKIGKPKKLIQLENIDSSGTRSIYNYLVNHKHESLPLKVFNDIGLFLWNHLYDPNTGTTPIHLFLLQQDCGLGIILPQDNTDNRFSFRQDNPLEKIYLNGIDK